MASAYKFMNRLRTLVKGGTLLSAAAVTAMTATSGGNKAKTVDNGKDKVVFITKEENSIRPTVRVPVNLDLSENRDPVLPNGEINLACQCIEKDIVGPCNHEFRKLRVFMHESNIEDIASLTKEVTKKLDGLFEAYILCTMEHPVYYKDNLLEEEIQDMENERLRQEKLLQEQQMAREANTRNFGKDTVVFLTKEEAGIKNSVLVPKVEVEEYRGPLNPDGSLNWGCTCIEKDVVGPCNVEFRKFRLLAESMRGLEIETFSEDSMQVFSNFLVCVRQNPVYYSSLLDSTKDSDKDGETSVTPDNIEK